MRVKKEVLQKAIQADLDNDRSLRWIAEQMGGNHGTLSNLMTGRTATPDPETVDQIVTHYKLDPAEVYDFGETLVNIDRLPAEIRREFLLMLTRGVK